MQAAQPNIPLNLKTTDGGIALVEGADAGVVLDWKGDRMTINPGDKLGGLF